MLAQKHKNPEQRRLFQGTSPGARAAHQGDSSLIQTILSASEFHRTGSAGAEFAGCDRRWGIAPRPEDPIFVRIYIYAPAWPASRELARIAAILQARYLAARAARAASGEGGRVQTAIELDEVTYAYAGAAARALDHVSFSLDEGEFVCIIGANGSGKSTLARHLNALLVPSAGKVRVFGCDTAAAGAASRVRPRVGMVFQADRRRRRRLWPRKPRASFREGGRARACGA